MPTEAPWRVFLSHTAELAALPASRPFVSAAEDAVSDAGHAIRDMARFTADPRPPAAVCRAAVDDCDVYVLIAGFRYGSPVPEESAVSYTQLEFRHAASSGKPMLCFLLGDHTEGPPALRHDPVHAARQEAFRAEVQGAGVTTAFVNSPPELAEKLSRALGTLAASRRRAWSIPPLRGDEVTRPTLHAALVAALLDPAATAVGLTTGLVGAGGFGKTTLARTVAHDPAVRRAFPDGAVWVTLAEDVEGPDLAARITSVARLFDPAVPAVTDPLAAGAALGQAVGSRRVLLVVDDVWSSAQVEPFLLGGGGIVRLFTTRRRDVLPGSAVPVQVDQMAVAEARELLTAGLVLPRPLVDAALDATGRWPVLLSLVHGAVRDAARLGGDAAAELRDVLAALRTDGITALDVEDAGRRGAAVAATIEVGLGRLTADEQRRYRELAVFGEDVPVPGDVLARLWARTGGWSAFRTRRFCHRLFDLGLLADHRRDPERSLLHDVVRAYLLLGAERPALDAALVDAHRVLVPDGRWGALPAEHAYLWTWLPTHLRGAGLTGELDAVLADPAWLVGKLEHVGPAGLEADLLLSREPTCHALATVVRQNAHVLGPLDPPGSLAATFASRLPHGAALDGVRAGVLATIAGPHLRAVATLPDLPHPALVRVLAGHEGAGVGVVGPSGGTWFASSDVVAVRVWDADDGRLRHTLAVDASEGVSLAVPPDGTWLATVERRTGAVRIWDPATGRLRHAVAEPASSLVDPVAAPDGTWLAGVGAGLVVHVWDAGTGRLRCTLPRHDRGVVTLLAGPDGSWLATADLDGGVGVWDVATARLVQVLPGVGVTRWVLLADPAGTWIATVDSNGTIDVHDRATGRIRHSLPGHHGPTTVAVLSPDGTWLASATDRGGTVDLWDPSTGRLRHTLTGHVGTVFAMAAAADGTWLATGCLDHAVRIWDTATGALRQVLTGHTQEVQSLLVRGSAWLASSTRDRTVRIWDPTTVLRHDPPRDPSEEFGNLTVDPHGERFAMSSEEGTVRTWDVATGRPSPPHPGPDVWATAVARDPGGTWFALRDGDKALRIVDRAGRPRHVLSGHAEKVTALAVAPDGTWLASGCSHDPVRIWDPATGRLLHTLESPNGWVTGFAVAPDGSRLAVHHNVEIGIWDPATGRLHHLLRGHTNSVGALRWSPDGTWLASAAHDRTVRIWDVATGRLRHTLTGHTDEPFRLVTAPDGTWLASAGWDRHVRVWEPVTGRLRHVLDRGTRLRVGALTTVAGGSLLLSAGVDHDVRIWDPTTGRSVTSLRVADSLWQVHVRGDRIVLTSFRGPYVLDLVTGT